MSLTSQPISEGEQASEKLADHVADRVEHESAGIFRQFLDVLTEYRISFSLGLEKKV